jgi:hypothetical protein
MDRHAKRHRAVVLAVTSLVTACSSSSGPHNTAPTTGTVTGIVSSSQGGGIAGATVIVTPLAGPAATPVVTDSTGAYRVLNVPVGTGGGSIAVAHLPSTCSARDSTTYSGLAGGQSATADVTVPCTFAGSGIVMWFSAYPGLEGLTASQLVGGFPTPAAITVAQPTSGIAFDGSGNLWVAVDAAQGSAESNYLYEYTPSQLTTATTPPPMFGMPSTPVTPVIAIQLPNAFAPFGIAFDKSGTLWATGSDVGLLYGLSPAQLRTSGAPTPAHAFQLRADSASTLFAPTFAANGDLWIAGQDPNNGAGFLLRLTSAQLGSPNGPLAPTDSLLRGRGLDPSIDPPSALAFDTVGNLWIGGGPFPSHIVMFAKTALPASRGDTVDVAPTVSISATFPNTSGMAFDISGNLWASPSAPISHPISYLLRYPASAIAPGGSGKPDVLDSLNGPIFSLSSVTFAPRALGSSHR